MFRSSNPVLNPNMALHLSRAEEGQAMSIQGTVNKTFFFLFLVMTSAYWAWGRIMKDAILFYHQAGQVPAASNFFPMAIGASFLAMIFAFLTIFKKEWAMITGSIYALLQGVFLGSISAIFELQYPGIATQAIALTFGTLFALLLVYKSGLIKVTDKFRLGIFAATGGIAVIYILSLMLGFFGGGIPLIHSASPLGIGFSLFVVGIAALNLILDFDFIERGSQHGLPRYMEWYAAFGLMITLVWLYVEILRLLSKMRRR